MTPGADLQGLHTQLAAAMGEAWPRWGLDDATPATPLDLLFVRHDAPPDRDHPFRRAGAVVGLAARNADPRTLAGDEKAPLDAASTGLRRAADRAKRIGAERRDLARRIAAAHRVGLAFRAPHPPAAPVVVYHGGAHHGLLALERFLLKDGVRMEAALTPVSLMDRLSQETADAVMLDARPGHDRAALIVRTLQRGVRTRTIAPFVLAETHCKTLDAAVMADGGVGVWPFAELATGAMAGWIADALRRRGARRATLDILGAINDSAIMQSPRRDGFLDAYLAACLAEAARTSVIIATVRDRAETHVRIHEVITMARRLVRPVDAVFWRAPWGLMIVAPDCGPDAGACITERLRSLGAMLGPAFGRIVHLRAPRAAPPAAVMARLETLLAKAHSG